MYIDYTVIYSIILVLPPPFPRCFNAIACTWNHLPRTNFWVSNQDKSPWPSASSSSAIPEVTRASYPEETGQSETTCLPPRRLSHFMGMFCILYNHIMQTCYSSSFLWWARILSRFREYAFTLVICRFWYDFDRLCVAVRVLSAILPQRALPFWFTEQRPTHGQVKELNHRTLFWCISYRILKTMVEKKHSAFRTYHSSRSTGSHASGPFSTQFTHT